MSEVLGYSPLLSTLTLQAMLMLISPLATLMISFVVAVGDVVAAVAVDVDDDVGVGVSVGIGVGEVAAFAESAGVEYVLLVTGNPVADAVAVVVVVACACKFVKVSI